MTRSRGRVDVPRATGQRAADAASPRWRRQAETRPSEIRAAALRCFKRHGFAEARVDDVAREAGLSKGTIYLYFPTKEHLLWELNCELLSSGIGRLKSVLGGDRQRERLTALLDWSWASDLITAAELAQSSPPRVGLDLARAEALENAARLVGNFINDGVRVGAFRPPEDTAALAFWIVAGPLITAPTSDEFGTGRAKIMAQLRRFIEQTLHGAPTSCTSERRGSGR